MKSLQSGKSKKFNHRLVKYPIKVPRKMTLSSALLLCVCSLASAEMPGTKVFVAPNGNDANPGTLAKPFATLQRAQQEARKQRSEDKVGGQKSVTVFLREGTCYLPEPLVGSSLL